MPLSSSSSVDPGGAQIARRPGLGIPVSRTDLLRAQLPRTMDCLKSRQANLIAEDLINDYVAMDWLEWAGGGLRLTETGRNVWAGINRQAARA